MDKIKELLAVLDMPEKKQREWTLINVFGERIPHESLADLAFRLRDEVDWELFAKACEIVRNFWCNLTWDVRKNLLEEKRKHIPESKFWKLKAQPIHWIIAALIAKELGKDIGKAGE